MSTWEMYSLHELDMRSISLVYIAFSIAHALAMLRAASIASRGPELPA